MVAFLVFDCLLREISLTAESEKFAESSTLCHSTTARCARVVDLDRITGVGESTSGVSRAEEAD